MSGSVVCGMQWGDEGKGKVIDFLTEHAHFVARYQGGNNAGHTVVVNGQKFVLHLLPSGVLNPHACCLLTPGVIIDPRVLLEELKALEARGLTTDHVFISERAHLIMPYHIRLDELKEDDQNAVKIGTTRRGIGPCYMDKYERTGIRACDLLNEEELKIKIGRNVRAKNIILEKVYKTEGFDAQKVYEEYMGYAKLLKHRIIDTTSLLHQALNEEKNVLFEGAQAVMLDIDHGNYPFVTSSSPTTASASVGAGVGPQHLENRIGVFKAYATRVGEGPFPSELFDELGERIRTTGGEFGSTTGRPRRTGWLDLVNLKYAHNINGFTELAMMKIDVLTGLEEIPVCIGYMIDGKLVETITADIFLMKRAKPIYKNFRGWQEDLSEIRNYEKLPTAAKDYINFIERELNCPITTISVGPGREQTIRR